MSFSDQLNRKPEELRAIASGFGGGMGKLQWTCGAITGAFMVFSEYAGKITDNNQDARNLSTAMIREFHQRYSKKYPSHRCRDILGVDMNTPEGQQEATEKNLFGTVCNEAVRNAADIVGQVIDDYK